MKQRKLFAILTLVAFMMTLLPMAAFAADANRHSSYLTVDKTKVDADLSKHAEFNVYVRDGGYTSVDTWVYIATERGVQLMTDTDKENLKKDEFTPRETDVIDVTFDNGVTTGTFTDTDADSKSYDYIAVLAKDGRVRFDLSSAVAGDSDVAVGLNPETAAYLLSSDVTANEAGLIGTRTVTFEATKASDVQLVEIEARKDNVIKSNEEDVENVEDVEVKTGKDKDEEGNEIAIIVKGDRQYGERNTPISADPAIVANGTDYYELTFRVANANNVPIKGETIKFSANRNNVRFNKDEVKTDEIGEATVRVYSNKAGAFEIEAANGSDTAKVWLQFGTAEISNIILAKETAKLVATDAEYPDSFRLEFRDANGYKIDPHAVSGWDAILEFEWITEPKDSDLADDLWENLLKDDAKPDKGKTLTMDGVKLQYTNDNLLRLWLPDLDEEGKYVLRVNIENGKYVDVEFEAKEQGDIVGLTLSYDTKSLQLGAKSTNPTVKRVDADGVAVDATNNLRWSINDYRVLANRSEFNNSGILVITDDDDYVGSYTVTVVDTRENVTATAQIEVGAEVIGLEVEAGKLVVNEDNTVTLRTIDAQGNVIALGKDISNFEFDAYVTSQPQGANASAEATNSDGKLQTDLENKGEASVDVYSREKGTVNMVFVVEYTKVVDSQTETFRFAQPVALAFGEAAADKPGAGNVTLFIGQQVAVVDGDASMLDVAPFIKDNRTFVPVRFVAEALGAEVKWDEATQTVTATRGDDVVVLTIGSNVMTVNGNAEVTDVAPFIAEGNRTVLPFRAVAEAFGAEVKAEFNNDGTTHSVIFTK